VHAVDRLFRDAGNRLSVALYETKTIVAKEPRIAIPIARWRGHGEVVDDRTEIVIEGYPRAASSFAVAAFRAAQGREVRIAHHVHAPAQVIVAERKGIPALVLARRPEDALVSHLIRSPALPIGSAARAYVRFYEPLLPLRPAIVTATFEEVVGDFGTVILRVNERYASDFVPFEHTEENVARIFREIDDDYRTRMEAGSRFERAVPRPSEHRDALSNELRERYRSSAFSDVRLRLERLYDRFVSAPSAS